MSRNLLTSILAGWLALAIYAVAFGRPSVLATVLLGFLLGGLARRQDRKDKDARG